MLINYRISYIYGYFYVATKNIFILTYIVIYDQYCSHYVC
jgi:hypothetical protein